MATSMKSPTEERVSELVPGTFMFLGIALSILGIVAILSSFIFTIGTVFMLGAILSIAGIAEFIHVFRMARKEGGRQLALNVLSAVVYLAIGIMLLSHPVIGAMSATLFISAFLILNGIISIADAVRHRAKPQWGWFLFSGALDLILGALIAYGWPATAMWVIGLFVGLEMLMYGFSWIALGLAAGNRQSLQPS